MKKKYINALSYLLCIPGIHFYGKSKVFLILSFMLAGQLLFNSLYAQTIDLKVTFELKNQTLESGLNKLGKISDFRIAFTLSQVAKYKNITVENGTRSLKETLNLLLENTNLTFVVKNKRILVVEQSIPKSKNADNIRRSIITGIVTDEENKPLTGVAVRVNSYYMRGTFTDAEGRYSIEADKGDLIVYSFIGYQSLDQKVSDKAIYNIQLSLNSKILDEVQVIGYGTTTRRLKTSGVATIKADEITNQQTTTNFLQTMQGKLAGVSISQSTGGVGSSPNIYIRGVNSITSGNAPLYIVDGIIISDDAPDQGAQGGFLAYSHNALSSINTSDIVSIDVLKDADATAIYGSRGANGVVLITTKKAEIGKTAFTFDVSTGFNSPIQTKYLNADQYTAFRKEAFAVNGVTPTAENAPDLTTWANNPTTDWTKYMNSNSGRIYNVSATLTGGSKALSYLASINYNENHDVLYMDPTDKKVSGKLNVNHVSENNKFKATFNVSYSNEKFTPGYGSSTYTSTNNYSLPPNFPLKDADGNYTWSGGSYDYNNVEAVELSKNTSKTVNYLVSTDLSYLIYNGLTLRLAASFNYLNNDYEVKINPLSLSPTSYTVAGVNQGFTTYNNYNLEPQLTYSTKIGKGTLDALLGSTWYSKTNDSYTVALSGYTSSAFYDSWSAATTSTLTSSYSKYNMRSLFSRIGYNWDNKYIANLTYRADGSSRFGSDNRWGNFGAVGGAWLFSNETFVKKTMPWLSYGKLRSSYGITGNDNIPDNQYKALYSLADEYGDALSYNGSSALLSTYLPNKSIKWEQTSKFEVAIENGFLKDRITTSLAYFFNRTTNMLLSVPIAGQTGYSYQLQNFQGVVDNKGLEVEINSTNIKTKNFGWKTNFNITFQKNELVSLPAELASQYEYSYQVGKPLLSYIYYKTAGVNPKDGSVLWVNPTDGSTSSTYGSTSAWSTQYLGSSLPTVFGGLTNSFTYKGFTLDIAISFAKKTMVDALYGNNSYSVGSAYNVPSFILGNYWQKEGDVKSYPKLDVTNSYTLTTASFTNLYMHEGYYFKLQNIALSYTIPSKLISRVGIGNLTVYVRGQNLGYWTPGNNLGKDPERNLSSGASILRSFVTGLNIKL